MGLWGWSCGLELWGWTEDTRYQQRNVIHETSIPGEEGGINMKKRMVAIGLFLVLVLISRYRMHIAVWDTGATEVIKKQSVAQPAEEPVVLHVYNTMGENIKYGAGGSSISIARCPELKLRVP